MNDGSIQSGDVFSKLGRTVVTLGLSGCVWSCSQWDGPKYIGPISMEEKYIYSDYTFERNIFDL